MTNITEETINMLNELTEEQKRELDLIASTVNMSAILLYLSKTTYEAADSTDGQQHLIQTAAAIRAAALLCVEWESV